MDAEFTKNCSEVDKLEGEEKKDLAINLSKKMGASIETEDPVTLQTIERLNSMQNFDKKYNLDSKNWESVRDKVIKLKVAQIGANIRNKAKYGYEKSEGYLEKTEQWASDLSADVKDLFINNQNYMEEFLIVLKKELSNIFLFGKEKFGPAANQTVFDILCFQKAIEEYKPEYFDDFFADFEKNFKKDCYVGKEKLKEKVSMYYDKLAGQNKD
jgi:hypothetical protein